MATKDGYGGMRISAVVVVCIACLVFCVAITATEPIPKQAILGIGLTMLLVLSVIFGGRTFTVLKGLADITLIGMSAFCLWGNPTRPMSFWLPIAAAVVINLFANIK